MTSTSTTSTTSTTPTTESKNDHQISTISNDPLFDPNLIEKIILPLTVQINAPICVVGVSVYIYDSYIKVFNVPSDQYQDWHTRLFTYHQQNGGDLIQVERFEEETGIKVPSKLMEMIGDAPDLYNLINVIFDLWEDFKVSNPCNMTFLKGMCCVFLGKDYSY